MQSHDHVLSIAIITKWARITLKACEILDARKACATATWQTYLVTRRNMVAVAPHQRSRRRSARILPPTIWRIAPTSQMKPSRMLWRRVGHFAPLYKRRRKTRKSRENQILSITLALNRGRDDKVHLRRRRRHDLHLQVV